MKAKISQIHSIYFVKILSPCPLFPSTQMYLHHLQTQENTFKRCFLQLFLLTVRSFIKFAFFKEITEKDFSNVTNTTLCPNTTCYPCILILILSLLLQILLLSLSLMYFFLRIILGTSKRPHQRLSI